MRHGIGDRLEVQAPRLVAAHQYGKGVVEAERREPFEIELLAVLALHLFVNRARVADGLVLQDGRERRAGVDPVRTVGHAVRRERILPRSPRNHGAILDADQCLLGATNIAPEDGLEGRIGDRIEGSVPPARDDPVRRTRGGRLVSP